MERDGADTPLTAVVCDDDPVLRGIVARFVADAGFDVIAETDNVLETIDAIERFGVDELVLDLALGAARGEDVLAEISRRKLRCRVTVYSAFASNVEELLNQGVASVVAKPDFDALRAALEDHAALGPVRFAGADAERRRRTAPQSADRAAAEEPLVVSPTGIVPPSELKALVDGLHPGDSILVLRVDGLDAIERMWGALIAADHRLEVARIARCTLRTQDRLGVSEGGEIVLLLIDGYPEAPEAVFRRMARSWEQSAGVGALQAGYATCNEREAPKMTFARAMGALGRTQSGVSTGQLVRA